MHFTYTFMYLFNIVNRIKFLIKTRFYTWCLIELMFLSTSRRYKTNYDCTNIRILLENFRWCVCKKIKMKSPFMYF